MKKIILATLIAVIVTTPCFAQEVDPEGLFSVEGTLWSACEVVFNVPFVGMNCDVEILFYQGGVYRFQALEGASYIDLGVVSILYKTWGRKWFGNNWGIAFAIMQPSIGLGVFSSIQYLPGGCRPLGFCYPPGCIIEVGIMFKIDDNWTPPEVE